MNRNILLGVLAVLIIGGGAYFMLAQKPAATTPAVTSGENTQSGSVEPAAEAARKDLTAKLSVDENSITIVKVTDTTWNDGCLGLGGPAESCLQALVPGFSVEMLASGKTYTYRTDKTGTTVRAETN